MRWATRSHLHLDRVATSWLILRFVDPEAEIAFLDWDQDPPDGPDAPILFGIPGVELSSHDDGGTAFAKVMRAHDIDDPVLARIERIVNVGVRHALEREPAPDQTEEEGTLGAALDYLGEGLGMGPDEAHLEAATFVYDGLYTLFQIRLLPDEVRAQAPARHPARIAYLRQAIGEPAGRSSDLD